MVEGLGFSGLLGFVVLYIFFFIAKKKKQKKSRLHMKGFVYYLFFIAKKRNKKNLGYTLIFFPLRKITSKQPKLPAVKQRVALNDLLFLWNLERLMLGRSLKNKMMV
jgi:hypothetical protein